MVGYIIKRIKAFGDAFRGIATFIKEGAHARIHLLAVALVTFAGFYFDLSNSDWIDLILCFALVLGLEAINSAIEYAVDLASPEYHDLAKKAKDVAAASVLIAAIFSVILAILIFSPHLFDF